MPSDHRQIRRSSGSPRRLLLALTAVTILSAGSLGWLGWELLGQEEAVEAQREQERLERQADQTVQAIERLLVAAEDRLADWVSRSSAPVPDPVDGGLIVTFTSTTIQASPSSRLLFYASVPQRPEAAADLFQEGELAEFRQRDYKRAAEIYRRLAESPGRAVQAAALMRLGRTLRSSSRRQESLAAYAELAALGDTPVIGLPADLVARSARMQVFAEIGQQDAARQEAQSLGEALASGRWMLTSGQYEHYVDAAAAWGGKTAKSNEDLALTRAACDLWIDWKDGVLGGRADPPLALSTSGRRAIRAGGTPLLAA